MKCNVTHLCGCMQHASCVEAPFRHAQNHRAFMGESISMPAVEMGVPGYAFCMNIMPRPASLHHDHETYA
jgi:hypothetical protein